MSNLTIRPATDTDCLYVYRLSNDPTIRQWSTRTGEHTEDEHKRWWMRRFGKPELTRFWIAEQDTIPVGYIRYSKVVPDEFHANAEEACEISIAVDPSSQGKGFGRELLKETMPLACEWLMVKRLVALVLVGNQPSHGLFRSCGFMYSRMETRMGKLHVAYQWVAVE